MKNSVQFKRRLNHFLTYLYMVVLSIVIIYPLLITVLSAFKSGNVSAFTLDLSGNLNFPRRTISAYFNSAVASVFKEFKNAVYHALDTFHITAPVYILKADGGSLPIDTVESIPVETVFTGPAATVLGLEALRSTKEAHTVAP